jgi:hypothetical protein
MHARKITDMMDYALKSAARWWASTIGRARNQ